MASATSRRAVATAALAALATIGGSITALAMTGTASAAAPALTAPKMSPADGSTDAETRPLISAQYNTPLNQTTSTISVVDTSANNAAVPCTPSFADSGETIECTLQQDNIDKHAYKVSVHAENADGSSKRDDTATWTTDIPSVVPPTTPADGTTVAAASSVRVVWDEEVSTKSTATMVNGNGNNVPGSVSFSTPGRSPSNPNPTTNSIMTFNAGQSLPAGTYVATFNVHGVNPPIGPETAQNPATDNPNATASVVIHFTVDKSTPVAPPTNVVGPAAINSLNATAAPFSGLAPEGANVGVTMYSETDDIDSNGNHIPEGTGSVDSNGSTVVATCATPTMVNGIPYCPWTIKLDTSNSPDSGSQPPGEPFGCDCSYQWWAYTFTLIQNKLPNACPAKSATCPAADPAINKDTTGSNSQPSGGDGYVTGDTSCSTATTTGCPASLTVEGVSDPNDDPTDPVLGFRVRATDPQGNVKIWDVAGTAASAKGPVTMPTSTFNDLNTADDNGPALNDGALKIEVADTDADKNPSSFTTVNTKSPTVSGVPPTTTNYTETKETVKVAPDTFTTPTPNTLTDVDGHQFFFSDVNNLGIHTPQSVTVYFNELIRLVATDTRPSPNGPSTIASSEICLNDSTGLCVNRGKGTYALTKDNKGLIWTAPSGFATTLKDGTYSIGAFAVAATCQDRTEQNTNGYSCETSSSATSGPQLVHFTIDNKAPVAPTVTVTPSPTIDGSIDASGKPNISDVTFAGTAEAGSKVVVKVKSSAGGPQLIANGGAPVTADSSGNWSIPAQNLTTIPDGVLAVTATATDIAGNTSVAGTPTVAPTLAARPSPPQNLTATVNTTSVMLSWNPPATNGGQALTGYTLVYTDKTAGTASQTANPTASPYTVSGLVTGDTYTFALCGTNGIGGPCNNATLTAVPTNPSTLTALVSHSTVTYGTRITLSGRLTDKNSGIGLASKTVTITPRYDNGTHGSAIRVTTSSAGGWSVAFIPAHNALYTAVYAGDKTSGSATASVRSFVRERVLMSESSRSSSHTVSVTISGSAGPNQSGRLIYIYEKTSRGNKLVGRVRLSSSSIYSLSHLFSRGTHTIFAEFFAQNGNASGVSHTVRFTRS